MKAKRRMRWRIALEAARHIAEDGMTDYHGAKQKAASRLGIDPMGPLPDNDELEQALQEYYRIYHGPRQAARLKHLRRIAVEAMTFLRSFSPRLAGSVLEGSAGDHSPVTLYLFPQTFEEVLIGLENAGIPFSEGSHTFNTGKTRVPEYPALHFFVDGVRLELLLFPPQILRQGLKSNGRGLRWATIAEVRDLIDQERAEIYG